MNSDKINSIVTNVMYSPYKMLLVWILLSLTFCDRTGTDEDMHDLLFDKYKSTEVLKSLK